MKILHVKGKMGRWFEFTLFSTARTVCVKETTIKAIMPGGSGGSVVYCDGSYSYFHVTTDYEEILKALTLEERD